MASHCWVFMVSDPLALKHISSTKKDTCQHFEHSVEYKPASQFLRVVALMSISGFSCFEAFVERSLCVKRTD